jgi:hypothetical protein
VPGETIGDVEGAVIRGVYVPAIAGSLAVRRHDPIFVGIDV